MTDPEYMTDEGSEANDFERELLQAARAVRLSDEEKQAIWAGVVMQAAPMIAATPSLAPAAATSKATLGLTPLVKAWVVAVSVGGLAAGGYWLSRAPVSAPPAPPSAPAAGPSAHEASPAADAPPVPAATTSTAESTSAPSSSSREASSLPVNRETSPNDKRSALGDESAAVLEIRRTLRAGDAGNALRLLEQARQRFPKGALSQEREALSIEALAKSGARSAAARKAQAFLRAYPKSPYASDVRSFAAE